MGGCMNTTHIHTHTHTHTHAHAHAHAHAAHAHARTLGLRKTVSMCLFSTCTTVGVTFIDGHLFRHHIRVSGFGFRV
jgi:hypothetical protein